MMEASSDVVSLVELIVDASDRYKEQELANLDKFNKDIKYVETKLKKAGVSNFYYNWHDQEDDFHFTLGLFWNSKLGHIMHRFEDEDPKRLLTCTAAVRMDCIFHFDDFLEAGVERFRKDTV